MQKIIRIQKSILMVIVLLLTMQQRGISQVVQSDLSLSQYFQNKMLWNAAYTGKEGNRMYAFQNRSWMGFDGAPVVTNFSGEFTFGLNSSMGLQLMSDIVGALNRTYGLVNYAYSVKLSEQERVRLGVSFAFGGERINSKYVAGGGQADPAVLSQVNSRMQFDGNFGVVYERERLELGLSVFRIGDNIRGGKNVANLPVVQMGGYYHIDLQGDERLMLRPMAMLRMYKSTSAVADVGAEFEYNKLFSVMSVYQSSGNIRFGAGVSKEGLGSAHFFYNTNSKLSHQASQQYELGLGIALGGRKN